MKKFFLIISALLFIVINAYSQDILTNDYKTANQITTNFDCNFIKYIYDNTVELLEDSNLQSDRLRLNKVSSYFSFIIPQTGDATLNVKFENDKNFGLALYKKTTPEQYEFLEYQKFENQKLAEMKILSSQELANTEIFCRFWDIEESSQGNIYICISTKEITIPYQTRNVSINTTLTPQQLVETLVTGCLTATNINFTGDARAIGSFYSGIPGVGISEGVLISTGKVTDAVGPNNSGNTSTGLGQPGSQIIDAMIAGGTTKDAAILEFDFVPSSNHIEFQYVFASEEYPEYAGSQFNDIFAFLISGGPENYNNLNIALIPNTSTPVSINNVNQNTNSEYYISNPQNSPDLEFDGLTVVLTASCDLTQCETYHIMLMIADIADDRYDSAVFLKANSFSSGESFSYEAHNTWANDVEIYKGCENYLKFCRMANSDYDSPLYISFSIGGTAMEGIDFSEIPTSIVIPEEIACVEIPFTTYENPSSNQAVDIELTFITGCPCSPEQSTFSINILPALAPNLSLTNSGPICIGETATISLDIEFPNQDNISANWSTGDTDVSYIEVSPSFNTDYYVDINYPCGTERLSTTLLIDYAPSINLGPDQIIVGSLSTILNTPVNPGNSGIWTVLDNIPGVVIQNPSNTTTLVTVPQTGEYQFTWTETTAIANCVSSDDIIIKFSPPPNADFQVTSPNCFEDNIIVTYTGETTTENPAFHWNFGNATIISGSGQGPYEIHFPNAGSFTIQLSVIENNSAGYNAVIVKVPEKIQGEIISYQTKCFESCDAYAIINTIGGTPPYSYSWESETNQLSNLCKGSYSLDVTDSKGCSFSKDFEITQPEPLSLDFESSNLSCYNDQSGTISVNILGGTSPYNYSWSDGGANSPIRTNLPAGNFSLLAYDKNNCTISQEFTLIQPEEINISTNGNFNICQGETVNIITFASGGINPLRYFWEINNTGISNPGDANIGTHTITVSPSEDTNYIVYAEDEHNCKSNYAFSQVKISPSMKLEISLEHNKCKGECDGKASLEISGGLRPFVYSWASSTPILNETCAGNYQLTVTDNFNCSESINFTIEEPESKINTEIITTNASCSDSEDGTIKITPFGGIEPYQYTWSINSSASSISGPAGNYSATITDANNCKENITATIYAPDPLEIMPISDQTICINGSSMITAQAIGGTAPYDYQWTGENGEIFNSNQFNASPTITTEYMLTVKDNNNCENKQGKVKVKVNPEISISNIIGEPSTLCEGEKVLLDANISGGDGGPYTITDNNGNIINFPHTFFPKESALFTITVKDNCETPAVEKSIFIEVLARPEVNFSSDIQEACQNTIITFSPLPSQDINSYYWEIGSAHFSQEAEIIHKFEKNGIYNISLTLTGINGCKNKLTKQNYIQIHKNPEAIFIANPESAGINKPQIHFSNQSIGAIYNYWYFGDKDSIANIKNPSHLYKDIGEYFVSLICESSFACRDTCTRMVIIRDEFAVYAPTAFTPNGDGLNDCFRLCGKGINPETFSMRIYDRWGEIVFLTNKFFPAADCASCDEAAWDGSKNSKQKGGKLLPSGLYIWYASFLDLDNVEHEYSGTVNIIR